MTITARTPYQVWYVYVLYWPPPGAVLSLGTGGGGVYPNIRDWTLPRKPQKPPFFRKRQRLREIHSYKYCILKIPHNCTMSKQCLSSLIMLDCYMHAYVIVKWSSQKVWLLRRSDLSHLIVMQFYNVRRIRLY
jgi:hypothetical protein